jgi:hypothetical protein
MIDTYSSCPGHASQAILGPEPSLRAVDVLPASHPRWSLRAARCGRNSLWLERGEPYPFHRRALSFVLRIKLSAYHAHEHHVVCVSALTSTGLTSTYVSFSTRCAYLMRLSIRLSANAKSRAASYPVCAHDFRYGIPPSHPRSRAHVPQVPSLPSLSSLFSFADNDSRPISSMLPRTSRKSTTRRRTTSLTARAKAKLDRRTKSSSNPSVRPGPPRLRAGTTTAVDSPTP